MWFIGRLVVFVELLLLWKVGWSVESFVREEVMATRSLCCFVLPCFLLGLAWLSFLVFLSLCFALLCFALLCSAFWLGPARLGLTRLGWLGFALPCSALLRLACLLAEK